MAAGDRALLLRCDASPAIGWGHVLRCLALAQAAAEQGIPSRFAIVDPPSALAERLRSAGAAVLALAPLASEQGDVQRTLALAPPGTSVVLDGYQFGTAHQAALVRAGRRTMAMDDHGHAGRYEAHLVVNQNAGADAAPYRDRAAHTELALGVRYALLRDELRRWDRPRRAPPEHARTIVVSFGGSDPPNLTTRVVRGLDRLPDALSIVVIVGGSNPHAADIERAAAECRHDVRVIHDALDMPALLAEADLAIASASGTSWELARVGTPQVAAAIALNQRPAADALARQRLAIPLGWHEQIDESTVARVVAPVIADRRLRAELSSAGMRAVDGRGAERVLARLLGTAGG